MSTPPISRLRKVDLRKAWQSESGDFTPWLARNENLELLGDAIGIELECDSTESGVGPYKADIVCKDLANDSWVLIENQLERTDHTHLGQLLTYAAGLHAVTIVWIAERFTDEHRAALDWLNEHTDDKVNFFGLEVELWRIDDSPIAPKFNIVSQPNDWSRTIQQAAAAAGGVSEHKQLQLRFWTAFRDFMEARKSKVRCQKPRPRHWMDHAIGRTGMHLASCVSSWNSITGMKGPEIRAELVLNGPDAEGEFAALEQRKDHIQKQLGFELTWHDPEGKHKRRIYTRWDTDFLDESRWPECFDWLHQRLEALDRCFRPLVKNLNTD